MSTQVILLERIEKLGAMGDVVSVKPGYARNHLIPKGKALRATKTNLAYYEAQKKHLDAENSKKRKDAEKKAQKLEGLKIPLIRQASETGQLFGSVTSRDIADETSKVSGEEISRSMVRLNSNFKTIGLFPVDVALHPEVKVQIIINIARTNEEAEIQAETGKALLAQDIEETEIVEPEGNLEDVLEEDALVAIESEQENADAEPQETSEDKKAE